MSILFENYGLHDKNQNFSYNVSQIVVSVTDKRLIINFDLFKLLLL